MVLTLTRFRIVYPTRHAVTVTLILSQIGMNGIVNLTILGARMILVEILIHSPRMVIVDHILNHPNRSPHPIIDIRSL